ncbi:MULTISPECIES: hypothetical protein [Peribacillus]|uniref:hypothetical protein n=1 Tax=Peribacillus TaxID=2675229 RepID=UPI003334F8FE
MLEEQPILNETDEDFGAVIHKGVEAVARGCWYILCKSYVGVQAFFYFSSCG